MKFIVTVRQLRSKKKKVDKKQKATTVTTTTTPGVATGTTFEGKTLSPTQVARTTPDFASPSQTHVAKASGDNLPLSRDPEAKGKAGAPTKINPWSIKSKNGSSDNIFSSPRDLYLGYEADVIQDKKFEEEWNWRMLEEKILAQYVNPKAENETGITPTNLFPFSGTGGEVVTQTENTPCGAGSGTRQPLLQDSPDQGSSRSTSRTHTQDLFETPQTKNLRGSRGRGEGEQEQLQDSPFQNSETARFGDI